MGARPLRRVIQEHIEDRVADYYLDNPHVKTILFDVNEDNDIVIKENDSQIDD